MASDEGTVSLIIQSASLFIVTVDSCMLPSLVKCFKVYQYNSFGKICRLVSVSSVIYVSVVTPFVKIGNR